MRGAPIAGPSAREETLKEIGVQEVVIRDRLSFELEKLVRYFVKYFPVLVAVFAAIYIPYRIAMALGMGDDLETMPDWIGITGMGIAIAALIFGKFIRGRSGWTATLIFVAWFILSPDFVSRSEQVNLDDARVTGSLQGWARQVSYCKKATATLEPEGTIDAATIGNMVEQCNRKEKSFLGLVANSTDEQLDSICSANFRAMHGPYVDAVCTSRNL